MHRRRQKQRLAEASALGILTLAVALVSAYLLLGELAPYSFLEFGQRSGLLRDWQTRQVLLISTLSLISLPLGRLRGRIWWRSGEGSSLESTSLALGVFSALNVLPLAATTVTTIWVRLSDNCPFRRSETPACNYLSLVLDNLGLVSARVARLDLGVTLLLCSRGKSAWLHHATGGCVGFTGALPLHRAAGWWCAGQSAIHSVAYLLFYLYQGGGWKSVWDWCFPVPMETHLNTLGLVNFFGVVAFLLVLVLGLFAVNWLRRSRYDIFQRMHLLLGLLFVVFCALHDLPILLFAAPGFADWFFGWRFEDTAARTMPARARVLEGTSGPWVELTLHCSGDIAVAAAAAEASAYRRSRNGPERIREQWVAISLPKHLGKESHPFSLAFISSTELSVLISAGAGDWTRGLARLKSEVEEAVVSGPFPGEGEGGEIDTFGDLMADDGASKDCQQEPNTKLLLIAGGTGISGWMPTLEAMRRTHARVLPSPQANIRLAWLVQTEADYMALARRLPRSPIVDVTIFITRPDSSDTKQRGKGMDSIKGKEDKENEGDEGSVAGHHQLGTFSSYPFVSLTAAIVGLVVQHYLWRGWLVSFLGWSRHDMMSYTVVYRTLPIAVIVGCMAATTGLGSWFIRQRRRPILVTKDCCCSGGASYQRVGSFCEDQQTGDEECHPYAQMAKPDFLSGLSNQIESKLSMEHPRKRSSSGSSSSSSYLHEVRFGRPDIAALVHESVAGLPPSRLGAPSRLVVAACGPPKMVLTAEKVVKATQKSSASDNICLQFSGSDSRW